MTEPRTKLSGTVVRLGVVSLLSDMASELIVPLMPIFLTGVLHASNAFVGAIDGAADTVSSFSKVLAGRYSDKRSKRKPLVFAGYTLAALVRPLIALATAPWHVLAIRITDRIGKGVRTAPRDAWIASVASDKDRARSYGFHRAMDNAGNCLGPLLGLILYKFFNLPLRWVFACAAIPGALALLALYLTPEGDMEVAEAVSVNAPTSRPTHPSPARSKSSSEFSFSSLSRTPATRSSSSKPKPRAQPKRRSLSCGQPSPASVHCSPHQARCSPIT
jgi:MFS family permease